MAEGDWVPGTTARIPLINIQLDDSARPIHVGGGMQVYGPSGEFLREMGFNWNPTVEELANGAPLIAAIIQDALAAQGLAWKQPDPPAPFVPPNPH